MRTEEINRWCAIESAKCQLSLAYFATRYCISMKLNDDGTMTEELFPEYEFVLDTLDRMQVPNNQLVEKSRQMLGSWMAMAAILWDILFIPGANNLVLSRKQDLVDDGGRGSSADSLLGKVRFMHRRLPEWMATPIEFKKLRASNDVNGAQVTGESTNVDSGRGTTKRRIIIDESAAIEKSFAVAAATQAACPGGKMHISTPRGTDNYFGSMRWREEPPLGGYELVVLDWRDHPERDEEWYRDQASKLAPHQVAQELDRDYEASIPGKFYPFFSKKTQCLAWVYDPALPTYRTLDYGVGNPTVCVYVQKTPSGPVVLDCFSVTDMKLETIAELIMIRHLPPEAAEEYTPSPELRRRFVNLTSKFMGIREISGDYGDPAGKQRNPEDLIEHQKKLRQHTAAWAKRNAALLRKYGATATPLGVQSMHTPSLADRQAHGQQVMRVTRIDETQAAGFLRAVVERKYRTDDEGKVISNLAEEDWTKHYLDAYEYLVQHQWPNLAPKTDREPRRKRRSTSPTRGILLRKH